VESPAARLGVEFSSAPRKVCSVAGVTAPYRAGRARLTRAIPGWMEARSRRNGSADDGDLVIPVNHASSRIAGEGVQPMPVVNDDE
jgi:hypothetical protein